jgi:hypothetical protein
VPSRSAALALLLFLAASTALFAPPLTGSAADPMGSADEQMLAIGRDVPGFGGLFVDASGAVHVYVLDPQRDGGIATKALGPRATVLDGDYRFDDLLAWRYTLRSMLSQEGVTTLDVDEARNRVVLGVEPSLGAEARAALIARLATTGVPAGAVVLEDFGAVQELPADRVTAAAAAPPPTVQGKFRPAPGGVQVVFSGRFVCTLGFNATLGRDFGFVINDHCTDVRGEPDGAAYSQGIPGDGVIGTELKDPSFTTEGCPADRRCRMSDSAFARYTKKNLGILGRIARTTGQGDSEGSLRVSPPGSRFTLIGKAPDPLVGQLAHKVGRTTGWTAGEVVGTCVDSNVSGIDVTLLCQTFVAAGSGPGDSGSPVFSRAGGTQARLLGILWGGGTHPAFGQLFIFSPISAIDQELGTLKVN